MIKYKCNFCGINNDDERCALIILGMENTCICNNCVVDCVTIMNDKVNDAHTAKIRKERHNDNSVTDVES